MTRKEENGTVVAVAIIIITILFALVFSSCGTKKKVITETLYVHDTLRIAHTDTFMVEKWNYKHDTIKVESERIVTLLQSDKALPAETIRVVNNQRYFEKEIVRDSSASFISKIDSILRAMDRQHEKEKLTVKKEPPWNMLIFIVAILVACIIVLKDKK